MFLHYETVSCNSPRASVNSSVMHAIPVAYSTAITRLTVPQLSLYVNTWGRSALQHTTLRELFVCAILQGSGPSVLESYGPDGIRKHWRSVTSTPLQCASPSTRPVNPCPASLTNMHTRMRAVRILCDFMHLPYLLHIRLLL